MSEATPRPWTTDNIHVFGPNGEKVAKLEHNSEDGDVITEAVNRDHLFEELVEALKSQRSALDDLLKQIPNDEGLANYNFNYVEDVDLQAEAILAKVAEAEKS